MLSGRGYRPGGRARRRGGPDGWLDDWGGAYPMEGPGILAPGGRRRWPPMEGLAWTVEPVAPALFPAARASGEALGDSVAPSSSVGDEPRSPIRRDEISAQAMLPMQARNEIKPRVRAEGGPKCTGDTRDARGLSGGRAGRFFFSAVPTRSCSPRRRSGPSRWSKIAGPSGSATWRWTPNTCWMEVVVPASLGPIARAWDASLFGPAGVPAGGHVIGAPGCGMRRSWRWGAPITRPTDWPGRKPPHRPCTRGRRVRLTVPPSPVGTARLRVQASGRPGAAVRGARQV